ncbi:MAG: ABC transporter ATP-binding protein [Deltaproteobacteria bacterium]|nr:ABC transporter ATP-binding protein [Deltaproteobacteria bacterium]
MLLHIKDLHTYYGASHVLQGISLDVAEGELVALLGRNGMGKSTTLKSIMGLVKPRSGVVTFRGTNIFGYPPFKAARAGIGYVPEERRIFPTLSVADNLSLGIKGGKLRTNDTSIWTMERIFRHFPNLEKRAQQQGRVLSGGEQQMLTMGRSLMGNPQLLLIDEPTEGLAPIMVKEVRDVLAGINKAGVSILLVEHNFEVAMSLAERIYLMGKAYVGFSGTPQELQEQPAIREKYLEV